MVKLRQMTFKEIRSTDDKKYTEKEKEYIRLRVLVACPLSIIPSE